MSKATTGYVLIGSIIPVVVVIFGGLFWLNYALLSAERIDLPAFTLEYQTGAELAVILIGVVLSALYTHWVTEKADV